MITSAFFKQDYVYPKGQRWGDEIPLKGYFKGYVPSADIRGDSSAFCA